MNICFHGHFKRLKAVFHYVRFARAGGACFESRKFFNSQGELNNVRSARAGKADVMENSLKNGHQPFVEFVWLILITTVSKSCHWFLLGTISRHCGVPREGSRVCWRCFEIRGGFFKTNWTRRFPKVKNRREFKWLCDSELGWRIIMRCFFEWRTIPDKQRKIYLARLGFESATFGY